MKEKKAITNKLKSFKRYPCFLFTEQVLFLAQVNGKGEEFTIFRENVLPPGLVDGGAVVDPKKLGVFLAQVVKQVVLKETEVIVGLPELKATTQSVTLPQMGSDEITQAIENKAGTFLPLPYSEAYVDWQLIDKPKEGDMTVLVSAMPRTVIDGFVHAFEEAQLTPLSFETTATSLLRLIPPTTPEPVVAVDHTGLNATLIIAQKGGILFSSVLQNDADIAEKILRMTNYYLQQLENEVLTAGSICLSGKSITTDFMNRIGQQFNLKPILLSADITNIARERQVELAILGSLAKKEGSLPDDEKTVNLLPGEKARILDDERMFEKGKQYKMGALALMAIFLIMSIVSFFTMRNKTVALSKEIESISTQQTQSLVFNQGVITLVDMTISENDKLSNAIKVLFSQAPMGIQLTGIQFNSETGEMLLSGKATDRTALLEYRTALEKREEISRVTIPLSSLENEVDIEFRMQIEL